MVALSRIIFFWRQESKWGENRSLALVVEKGWNCSPPHDVAFGITWNLKKKGDTGIAAAYQTVSMCLHAPLLPHPRRVVCKWVAGSALAAWQLSACEGPYWREEPSGQTKFGVASAGIAFSNLCGGPASSGKHVCRTVLGFVLLHLHAHRIPLSVSLYHLCFSVSPRLFVMFSRLSFWFWGLYSANENLSLGILMQDEPQTGT